MNSVAQSVADKFGSADASADEINLALEKLHGEVEGCTPETADAIVTTLKPLIRLPDVERAAFASVLCIQISRMGSDIGLVEQELLDRLEGFVQLAHQIAKKASAFQAEGEEKDEDFELELEPILAQAPPDQLQAWSALSEDFWRPFYILFASSVSAREKAQPLRPMLAEIAQYNGQVHWLEMVSSVLEHEPIVVIDVENQIGAIGEFSGIPDNFQLNVLLMDLFPGSDQPRVSPAVAQNAKGEGPQSLGETVTGVWDLHGWKSLSADYKLSDSHDHWIWNEGRPEDIDQFNGHRVVLLAPASYQRGWGAQRLFVDMPAEVCFERELEKSEVVQWMDDMIRASK